MENIKSNLIDEICKKQDFDKILLNLLKQGKNEKVKTILKNIDKDNSINEKNKRQMYEMIFEYVNDTNQIIKDTVKEIFAYGIAETIKYLNRSK